MYEVFTTAGYGIVDGASQLATIDGFSPAIEVLQRVVLGEDVYVEEYDG